MEPNKGNLKSEEANKGMALQMLPPLLLLKAGHSECYEISYHWKVPACNPSGVNNLQGLARGTIRDSRYRCFVYLQYLVEQHQ